MNETNRFFVVINRINSVLLLVVFLLAAGGLILTFFMESQWRRNRIIEVQDKSEQGKIEKKT
jgi:cytochrome c oxidase subunit IV